MPGPSGDTNGKTRLEVSLAVVQRDLKYVREKADETQGMLKAHFDEDRLHWRQVEANTAALRRNQERDTDRYAAVVERVSRLEDQTDRIVVAEARANQARERPASLGKRRAPAPTQRAHDRGPRHRRLGGRRWCTQSDPGVDGRMSTERKQLLGWAHRLRGVSGHLREQRDGRDQGLDADAAIIDAVADEIQKAVRQDAEDAFDAADTVPLGIAPPKDDAE